MVVMQTLEFEDGGEEQGNTPRMQTLEFEDGGEEQRNKDQLIPQTTTQSSSAEAILNQSDMIEEILSRLPIKTLVQFRCVSKHWRSLISGPSFVKLQSNRKTHHRLIIPAINESNEKSYFLFADINGGSITHVLTIPNSKNSPKFNIEAQHVNGLLLFTTVDGFAENYLAFVHNPSTRNTFMVPPSDNPAGWKIHNSYLLGFNESSSEHMILNIKTMGFKFDGSAFNAMRLEIEIFSFSTYSWRKIDVDFPFDLRKQSYIRTRSVCVNSVIYYELEETRSILTFDLRTEMFSTMNFPSAHRFMMNISGFLGLLNHEPMGDKVEVWMLEDYKNQVWVKDTITLPDCVRESYFPCPVDVIGSCKIVFKPSPVSTDVLSIPIYDMKKRNFTFMEVNLTHKILCSETLCVNTFGVRSYVESMIPLKNSTELVPFLW